MIADLSSELPLWFLPGAAGLSMSQLGCLIYLDPSIEQSRQ